jgi:glycosyltransferase involved in cell wall biosynthesis
MILISIVIPTKNEGDNLKALCESLLKQIHKTFFEVVIIDDSDPGHEEYVKTCVYALRDAGVKVSYLRGDGKGVGSAMLKGLEASEGIYIFFLDADNILEEDFMSEVMPQIMKGAFVSLLSKSIISKGIAGLFYANQLLATLRRGLKFHKKYGFVNTLYIWRKETIARAAKLSNPKISLLDQVDLKSLMKENIIESKEHIHINRILVKDVRHMYEDFNPKFLYIRLKWYWGSIGRSVVGLRDIKLTTAIIPFASLLLCIISLLANSILLLVPTVLYTSLLFITLKIKHENPIIQLILGALWLLPLLLLKSIIAYIVLFSVLKRAIKGSLTAQKGASKHSNAFPRLI